MPQRTDIFDLARLGLTSGEGRRLELHVGIDPFAFGGQEYAAAPDLVPVRLDVSRTTGTAGRCGCASRSSSPGPACAASIPPTPEFAVDAFEVQQPGSRDEELTSPYVDDDGELDLAAWARDALALSLPAQITCRPDCAGLCASAGRTSTTSPTTRTRPSRTRAGRSSPRSGSTSGAEFATLLRRHGRPQAEAVALAHEQAPLDAQDLRAGGQRVPDCHKPRRPHRVCGNCGSYAGREVVHVHDHDHDHD